MRKTAVIDGWAVQLRVRTQRKKRKVNGKTRGRYEAKSAYVTVRAPDGRKRTWYVGSGDHLVRQVLDFGNGGGKISSLSGARAEGGTGRRKAAVTGKVDNRSQMQREADAAFYEGIVHTENGPRKRSGNDRWRK